jgi:hypothetical protein
MLTPADAPLTSEIGDGNLVHPSALSRRRISIIALVRPQTHS